MTFTISNNPPPRTNLIFPKISTGLVLRQRDVTKEPISSRRQIVGKLIFSTSSARRTTLGSNARQYELGQVLSFDEAETVEVTPMLVNPITEIRHDTNVLDDRSMGLSQEDSITIAAASLQVQDLLTDQLNSLKKRHVDAQTVITIQQKLMNELDKTISALNVVQTQVPNDDIAALMEKLELQRTSALEIRDANILLANDLANQADEVLTQLRTVAVVVK